MRASLLTIALFGCGSPASAPVKEPVPEPAEVELGCGDGEVRGDEACDDGNRLGGDGCTELCTVETGQLEAEPNDTWDAATPWDGGSAHGALPEGDVDCWAIEAPKCGSITARLLPPCAQDVALALHDPDGVAVAGGGVGPDGCAVLDPFVSPGATLVPEGTHAICVHSLVGNPLPSYTLAAELDPSGAGFPVPVDADLDGDGFPDRCDEDRDGDGVDDVVDNCVDVPNGPAMGPLGTSIDGFITSWLTLGPITGTTNTTGCRPSDDQATGDDPNAAPELGDQDAGLTWIAWFDADDRINFRDNYGWASPEREAYAHAYVYSAAQRDLILALGADDGVFSWLNGVRLHDVDGCQGANIDEFQEPATLLAGWNRLTIKVRDHGGGWGLYARFLELGGAPVTDLEISLTAAGSWLDDQADSDGDGLGDVCDDTP